MRSILLATSLASLLLGSAVNARSITAYSNQDDDENRTLTSKACGTSEINYNHETDNKQHPTPEPDSGRALIYVVRPTGYGGAIQTKLAVDGSWKGVNKGKNYFFFMLEPGEHFFCSKSENRSVIPLTVDAGKTYYVQQKIRPGFNKARNRLELIDERSGRKAVEESRYSTWTEKGR